MRSASVGQLLGPLRCSGCRTWGRVLCDACQRTLETPDPIPPLPPIDRVLASWRYEGAARALVLDLKVRGLFSAAGPLVEAIAGKARACGVAAQAVAWVPARGRDVRIRGFDHAEVLAKGTARELGLPAVPLLRRARVVRDQVTLDASERATNQLGAFAAVACPKTVLLVDDVLTTGATVQACAAALVASGAWGIEVGVACRA